jgi:hypothetical protein
MPSERSIPPVEIYKQIIDGLVKDSPSLGARLVAEEGIYSKAPAHQPLNALVQRLTSEERSVLVDMLTHERFCAIHDVLAAITWWIDCRDVALTYRGELMPVQLSGMGLHGDYVGRRDGWAWPGGESQT